MSLTEEQIANGYRNALLEYAEVMTLVRADTRQYSVQQDIRKAFDKWSKAITAVELCGATVTQGFKKTLAIAVIKQYF
jgi:hypothetical protein